VDDVLFLNAGSVGKPKDGDWRARYAVLDTSTVAAEFVRIEYELPKVTAAIRGSELPHDFATDLERAGALPDENAEET
jgi:diadenosine tetraphosphatase ApaH/serine/threonine PP2A family protein phosphatase